MSVQYSFPLPIAELKGSPDGSWEVAGYVSTFGNRDRVGDIIVPGAFDKSLSDGRKIKFLFAHDQAQVLGTAISLKTDDHGLFGRFKISRTRLGEDVHTLLKDGALDSFSIGFFIDDIRWDDETESRMLTSIDLLEASVVAVPANPEAVVTSVKSQARMTMDEEADALVTSFRSFTDRCTSLRSLRARDGRVPGPAFFERLTTVRAAADELLSIKAPPITVDLLKGLEGDAKDLAVEMLREMRQDEGAPPPAEKAAGSDMTARIALRRARLRHAGILEMPSDEHDRRRGT